MTKQEIREKLSEIKDEAIKIDHIEDICTSMRRSFSSINDPIAQKALFVGFADVLGKEYDKIKYIWLHVYNLYKAMEEDIEAERTIDNDGTVDTDEEVTE